MTTLAIMQPYFFPYAGYYRLFAEADVFVIFDCVQFPRRGWVHRNKLPRADGEFSWLNLPFQKADYHAPISSICFASEAQNVFLERCQAFPLLHNAINTLGDSPLIQELLNFEGSPVDYLERTLKLSAQLLGYSPRFIRSSSLLLDEGISGQDRVLTIAKTCGARNYINLSGGVDYYDPQMFLSEGINLKIFTPYEGKSTSMLARLLSESTTDIKEEISTNLTYINLTP